LDLAALNRSELDGEIQLVLSGPGVQKLRAVRNRYLSHREAAVVGSGTLDSIPTLQGAELEGLVSWAFEITNKYNQLLLNNIVAPKLPGIDDYESLLRLIRRGLESIQD
jgi:hypothetical protein